MRRRSIIAALLVALVLLLVVLAMTWGRIEPANEGGNPVADAPSVAASPARRARPGRPVGPRALPREAGEEVRIVRPRAPAQDTGAEAAGEVGTVTVVVTDPRRTGRARLLRRGCRGISKLYRAAVSDGRTEFDLDVMPGPCVLQASRPDGALPAWSESVDLEIVAGEHYDVDLALPSERTGGLGVAIEADERGIRVNETHPDTPAGRLGLDAGDLIVEVDGLPAAMLSLGEFQQVMTGPEGTSVRFLVEHPDGDAVESYTIRRTFLRVDDDGVHGEPVDTGE